MNLTELKGRAYLKLKKYDAAARVYENLLKKNPDDVYNLYELSGIYDLQKNYDAKENILLKLLELGEDPGELLVHLWQAQFEQGKIDVARKTIEDFLIKNPGNPVALNLMGKIFMDEKDNEKALDYFKKAREIDPSFVFPWLNTGLVYSETGELNEAEIYLRKAVELGDKLALAWNNLGMNCYRQKNLGEAEECFLKAMKLDPYLSFSWYNLGLIYTERGKHARAGKYLRKALDLDPGLVQAWCNLGVNYLLKEKYDEAKAAFDRGLELDSKFPLIHYNLSLIYLEEGKYTEALTTLETSKENGLPGERYYFMKGLILYTDEKYAEAELALARCIKLDPTNHEAWLYEGYCAFELKNYQKSLEYLEHAVDHEPDNAEFLFTLGVVYYETKKYDKALDVFKRTSELKPDLPGAWILPGYIYYEKEDYDKCITAFRNAARIDEDMFDEWSRLGEVYAHKREYRHAGNACKKAIKQDQNNAHAWYCLVHSEIALGKFDKAVRSVDRAAKILKEEKDNLTYFIFLRGYIAWLNNKQTGKAKKYLYDCLKRGESFYGLYGLLGHIELLSGNYKESNELFLKASAISKIEKTFLYESLYSLAISEFMLENRGYAVKIIKSISQSVSNDFISDIIPVLSSDGFPYEKKSIKLKSAIKETLQSIATIDPNLLEIKPVPVCEIIDKIPEAEHVQEDRYIFRGLDTVSPPAISSSFMEPVKSPKTIKPLVMISSDISDITTENAVICRTWRRDDRRISVELMKFNSASFTTSQPRNTVTIIKKAEKIISNISSPAETKKNGQDMFESLFGRRNSKKVNHYLKDTRFFRIDVDDATCSIPYELLYINDDYLSMRKLCYRYLTSPRNLKQKEIESPLKMMIIANPASSRNPHLEWVTGERQELQKILLPLVEQGKICFDTVTDRLTAPDMISILNQYDIVHFAGHACRDSSGDDLGWNLGDGLFSENSLQEDDFVKMPALIFSNACHSGTVSFQAEELARKFVRFGVSNYIGTFGEIPDTEHTVKFVTEFYKYFFGAKDIDAGKVNPVAVALYYARRSTRELCPQTACWLNYMLYADPGFRFPVK